MYFYMVLSDGTTFLPLKGSKIIAVSDTFGSNGDDLDITVKEVCRDNELHPEVIIVTTFGDAVA